MPTAEALKAAGTDPKTAIDQYKELADVAEKSSLEMFRTIVAQALLPVFTGILGYIFGRGVKSE